MNNFPRNVLEVFCSLKQKLSSKEDTDNYIYVPVTYILQFNCNSLALIKVANQSRNVHKGADDTKHVVPIHRAFHWPRTGLFS